jgi:hypothetical protein
MNTDYQYPDLRGNVQKADIARTSIISSVKQIIIKIEQQQS